MFTYDNRFLNLFPMEYSKCINLNISKLEDEFAITIAWSNCLLTIAYYQANLSPS